MNEINIIIIIINKVIKGIWLVVVAVEPEKAGRLCVVA